MLRRGSDANPHHIQRGLIVLHTFSRIVCSAVGRHLHDRTTKSHIILEASYEVGKKLSMAEIDRKGMGVGVFAYGEAEIDSFAAVLSHAQPKPGEVGLPLLCWCILVLE